MRLKYQSMQNDFTRYDSPCANTAKTTTPDTAKTQETTPRHTHHDTNTPSMQSAVYTVKAIIMFFTTNHAILSLFSAFSVIL